MENNTEENIKKEKEDIYANVLYVADLPKETTNEDLQKLFQDYHFQFASLNNIKNNTTWAQVYLENKECANKARHELNGTILTPSNSEYITKGKPIRICKYEGKGPIRKNNIKQSLLIKNIDINMTQKEFYNIFLKFGDIVSGKIEYDENGISKGFGYIYYYTEESAEEAKKKLNGESFFGKQLEIVNLIPGKKNKSNTITLFVLNLPNDITEEKLSSIFGQFGPISNISINSKGFAYISYNNLESASKCLVQMKTNPISFPGLPNIVVKNATTKEERESNRNFISNNFGNSFNQNNLCIQFNYLYINNEIKNDLDLDKEIRLFIKVIMLMDYSPKEVLVDFESMSGLVIFGNFSDYNMFFKKYGEFCTKQGPVFECVPYEMPIPYNEPPQNNFNNNQNRNQMMNPGNNNNYQPPFNQFPNNNYKMMNNMNNFQGRNNSFPKGNIGMPYNMMMNPNNFNNMNNRMMMNNGMNYMNNNMQRNFNYNNMMNYKNNNGQFMNNNNRSKFNNDKNKNGQQRINNNRKINQRQNMPNNNQKFIFRQNYGNSYNINISMPQNMMPMNPMLHQQMMMLSKQNSQKLNNNNNRFNNMGNMGTPMYNYFPMGQNNKDIRENNNYMNNYQNDKNDNELIDQRNLQNLNPSQLLSQFNKPPINYNGPNMLDSKEQEDLVNEIADSIYEIVYGKYPKDASKITGMIKEKGYEKMNMLLSKPEDLNEMIDKAYEMINNSRNNNNNEMENSDNK